jgi:uncharacterized MAPEG superfamily protein
MTVDLWLVVATAVLSVFVAAVPLFAGMRRQWGLKAMLGNREGLPSLVGWAGRVQRAHRNLLENAPIFYALAILAYSMNANNSVTATGSMIFFGSRVVHLVAYSFGVPVVRTVAFTMSLIGLGIIGSQLSHTF